MAMSEFRLWRGRMRRGLQSLWVRLRYGERGIQCDGCLMRFPRLAVARKCKCGAYHCAKCERRFGNEYACYCGC